MATPDLQALLRRLHAAENGASEISDSPSPSSASQSPPSTATAASSRERINQAAPNAAPGGSKRSVVSLCDGMRVEPTGHERRLTSSSRPSQSNSSAPAVEPLELEELHRMLREAETPPPSKEHAWFNKTARKAVSATWGDHSTGPSLDRGHVTFTSTPTFAQGLREQSSSLEPIDGGLTTEGRLSRMKEKDELRARRLASRAERQEQADVAKFEHGLSGREVKEREKRAEQLQANLFGVAQYEAAKDYIRRSRWIAIANIISLCSQALFVYDVYQEKTPAQTNANAQSGMLPATRFVFIYTACGLFGSALALASIVILSAVLRAQGLKSPSLPKVCPVIVHVQYYSAFFQSLSLFNHISYLPEFFNRISQTYPGDQPWLTAIQMVEMALGAILPFVMVFNIVQNKLLCMKNLYRMVHPAAIQKHIYRSVCVGQIGSGAFVCVICGMNLYLIIDKAGGINEATLDLLRLNYTYVFFPVLGVASVSLGIFYGVVTLLTYRHDQASEELDAKREETARSGQRVQVAKGNECILQYLVETPQLNGRAAVIEANVADNNGMLTVRVDNHEYKVEEFQLGVALKPAELERVKEFAALRASALVYKHNRRGDFIARLQMGYVVLGQIFAGALALAIFLVLFVARFGALASFHELQNQIEAGTDAQRKFHQVHSCLYWQRCLEGMTRPTFCGGCELPRPPSITQEIIDNPSGGGGPFSSESLVLLVAFGSGFAFVGLVFGYSVLRCAAKASFVLSLCAGILTAAVFFVFGGAISTLPQQLSPHSLLTDEQCATDDLDPIAPGAQSVTTVCLLATGAQQIGNLFEQDARLSVTGCLVNALGFLLESLSRLSDAVRARSPNDWGKFEALVLFWYVICVCGLMFASVVLHAARGTGGLFDLFHEAFHENTVFSANASALYGDQFPLSLDQRWLFERMDELGPALWYNLSISAPLLIAIVCLQLIAIGVCQYEHCVKSLDEIRWIRTVRFVLVVDVVLVCTIFSAVCFLSLSAVHLIHNIMAMCIIPLAVQMYFAVRYALPSDILPILENLPSNPVLALGHCLAYALPCAALILVIIGLSVVRLFQTAHSVKDDVSAFDGGPGSPSVAPMTREAAQTLGFAMAGIGAVVLLIASTAVGIQFAYAAMHYGEDWSSFAWQTLTGWWEACFGTVEGVDDEQAAAAAAARQEMDLAESASAAAPRAVDGGGEDATGEAGLGEVELAEVKDKE